MAITRDPLRQLVKQADSVAESSLALTRRTLTQLQGQLTKLLKKKPNLAGCAADRDTFYKAVKAEAKILSERINVLQSRLVEAAGKGAARAAAHTTGMKVGYSEKRAKAIAELVTPAQGKNLAAVFTDNMAEHMIRALREATVQSIREQGAAGGTLKDQSRDLAAKWQTILGKDRPTFVDAAGRRWDGARYLQMNARTNAMRVYNDCLADDIARVSPSDKPLARISGDGDPNCDCGAWEGIIISLDGSDKRFPSYDDARLGGCFHPNCVHTLDYIDPVADEKEIDIQAKHPVKDGDVEDWDSIDERKYRIDQERYKEQGLNADEARLAVDRDNLTASLRNGLVDASARSIIDSLTDAQVTALCPNGNPPEFEPLKLTKRERAKMSDADFAELEKWNKGKYGGVVHIDREGLTAEKLLKVCKVEEAQSEETGSQTGGIKSGGDGIPPIDKGRETLSGHLVECGIDEETAVRAANRMASGVAAVAERTSVSFDDYIRHENGHIYISKESGDFTIAHEMGHAWWHKTATDEIRKRMEDAMIADRHIVEMALKTAFGDDWKFSCGQWRFDYGTKTRNEYASRVLKLSNIDYAKLNNKSREQQIIDKSLDAVMAVTNGECGTGHDVGKMANTAFAMHEFVAQCSACFREPEFARLFPNGVKLFKELADVDNPKSK